MNADEVRDDTKCGQGNNIDLRVPEEPEQVLEQQGVAADMIS